MCLVARASCDMVKIKMAEGARVAKPKGGKAKGTIDLRTMLNQIEALSVQLQRYRPSMGIGLAKLADIR